MINFAVINFKDAIKNLIKIIMVFLFIIGIKNISELIKNFDFKISYIDLVKNNLKFNYTENYEEKNLQKIIFSEIPILASSQNLENEQNSEEEIENNSENEVLEENTETTEVAVVQNTDDLRNLSTEVVSENNISESYNTLYNNVKIKNESSYDLTEDILTPDVEFTNKTDVIIYHTHTCESYTATEENSYVASGNYRTTDLNYSVAKVGSVLDEVLSNKGFNVNHLLTYHDYPAYNGSYSRSYDTVSNFLTSNNSSAQLVIDLHRDAVGSNSNYAPSVKIGDEVVAQLMIVVGTDGGGLTHDNWRTNLKYAIKIQEKAEELYPGLFRPIIVRNSRYNQNLADCSLIIEVGATGNTLEQATGSMKYLAEVLSEVIGE